MTQSFMPMTEIAACDASPADARAASRTVLHVIPGLAGGGAERFLRNLAREMQPTGWRAVIVVIRVGEHQALATELRSFGCTVHDLNESALLRPSVWFGIWRCIWQERPDVVQTWMHHADFIGGVAAWLAGVPRVVWGVRASEVWHNATDSQRKRRWFHTALRWASRLVPRRIIGNSQQALNAHAEMGYPTGKFVLIPNGIDAKRFAPNAEAGMQTRLEWDIPADAPVVGFVGRFHPQKDLALFLRVARVLQTQVPKLHLMLCGGCEADLYPAAADAFAQLPARGQVRFVPFTQETERLYPAFTFLALTSATEAFPNVVMEALACEVPVVTTAAGDAREMVADAGRVVALGDEAGMVQAWVETLALSPAQRAAQVRLGRERALTEYTMERAVQRFIHVYEEVAS
jgi:glycosyltransferase involved in cell wall biosynthesis